MTNYLPLGKLGKAIVFLLIAGVSYSFAQSPLIKFQTGSRTFPANMETFDIQSDVSQDEIIHGNYYRYIQFNQVPAQQVQDQMKQIGIFLLEYVPEYTYLASIPSSIKKASLQNLGIRSIVRPEVTHKVDEKLWDAPFPWYTMEGEYLRVTLMYYEDIPSTFVENQLNQLGVSIVVDKPYYHFMEVLIDPTSVGTVAALPYVSYLEMMHEPGQPEDTEGRSLQRSNMVNNSLSSGLRYDGTGVKMLVRDDGTIVPHIDLKGRFVELAVGSGGVEHGDGVAGVMAAAGNLHPLGQAGGSGTTVYNVDYESSFTDQTLPLHQTDTVLITNSSYSNGCNAGYQTNTQRIDRQIRENPSLMHVFSGGNSNNSNCGYGAGSQWGNVTGGHKMGKNVMTVANLFEDGDLVNSSSRGPAHDGRIKPDIAAHGQNQTSIDPGNIYGLFGGTSAAAPSMAGNMAQLYEAYKDMNAGVNPPSALIKATILNSAQDYGNVGPDFLFGWGTIHTYRAYEILANNQYLLDSISQAGSKTHTIQVPAGVKEMKVMVYWADREAAINAAPALVNNLDITITDPSATSHLPYILDPTPNPSNLSAPATRGVDNLNNMEQVAISNPAAGSYTLNVSGTAVPFGPQEYYVVYTFITEELRLTFPIGGEAFAPGEDEWIHWDTENLSGLIDLEYSADGGTNWSTIVSGLPSNTRTYLWNVPDTITGQAMVRINQNGLTDQSTENFNIIGRPTGVEFLQICDSNILVRWNKVEGADSYEIYVLGEKYMEVKATSVDTFGRVPAITSQENWIAVAALTDNGAKGGRGFATNVPPGPLNCSTTGLDAASIEIISPFNAPYNVCAFDSARVTMTIQNACLDTLTNIPVSLVTNLGITLFDTVPGPVLPGFLVNHTFSQNIVSPGSAGTYILSARTNLPGDVAAGNNFSSRNLILQNGNIFTLPFTQDFESFSLCGTANDCGATVCGLAEGWSNLTTGVYDESDWRTDANGTASNNTGPDVDYSEGTTAGRYLYTESSGGCTGIEHVMFSPCVDLSSVPTSAELTFAYHMFGATMGTLVVDVFNGFEWINVFGITGDQGNQWNLATIDLSAFVGNVITLRFVGITGSSFTSDIAIDAINIEDNSPAMPVPPVLSYTPSTQQECVNTGISFTTSATGINNTYTWDFGVDAVPATATGAGPHNVVYSSGGLKTVRIIANNSLGADTLDANLTIDPVPTPDFAASTTSGYQWSFANNSVNGNTYLWLFGDGNSSQVNSPNHDYTALGTYTVTLIATNACGSDTTTQNITVTGINAPQAGYVISDTSVCVGDLVVFTDQSVGIGNAWSWDFGANASLPSGSNSGPYNIIYNQPGTKTVRLIVTNSAGADTVDRTIIVEDVPLANFTFSNAVNQDFDFTNTTDFADSFIWSFGDGASSTMENPTHTYTANGNFDVMLIASNKCGVDTTIQTITVSGILAPVVGISSSDTVLCLGDSILVSDQTTGIGITSYEWTFGSAANLPSQTGTGPYFVSYNQPGSQMIRLAVTNSAGTTVDSIAVEVLDTPVSLFSFATPDNTLFNFTSNAQYATDFLWNFGDGTTSTDANPTYSYSATGEYEVELIVSNICGTDTFRQSVFVVLADLENSLTDLGINISPNPNQGLFQVLLSENIQGEIQLGMYDMRGRSVYQESWGAQAGNKTIDAGAISKGVYLLRIQLNDRVGFTRIVIE
ncbi:MAG: PKD domain-containing protein [Bacteroidota bacterium]